MCTVPDKRNTRSCTVKNWYYIFYTEQFFSPQLRGNDDDDVVTAAGAASNRRRTGGLILVHAEQVCPRNFRTVATSTILYTIREAGYWVFDQYLREITQYIINTRAWVKYSIDFSAVTLLYIIICKPAVHTGRTCPCAVYFRCRYAECGKYHRKLVTITPYISLTHPYK